MQVKPLFFALFSVLFLANCSKEKGCTDKDADNFNPAAEENDGSCKFSGTVIFWYGQDVAEIFTALGVSSILYYVDGNLIGSQAANVYWTAAPTCESSGVVKITKDLAGVKSKSFNYEVIDNTGFSWWDGTVWIDANTCKRLELD